MSEKRKSSLRLALLGVASFLAGKYLAVPPALVEAVLLSM